MSDNYPSTDQIMTEISSEKTSDASQPAEAQQPQEPSWKEDEYVIEGGKKVKETREMILKRAGMGYHYAQRMHEINQQAEKYKGYEERMAQLSRWQQYNDYAEQNPEWARHVEESWNNRSNMQQSSQEQPQTFQLPPELQKELSELKTFRDEILSARQNEKFQAEDKQFDAEIQDVATKHNVDLSQADEQGRSLEWRVLEHMKAMGLDGSKPGHFRTAFRDYYFDNLTERHKEQVKEEQAKTLEDHRKVGILGVSRTPKSNKNFNPANYSYDELAKMALADLEKASSR